MLSDPSIFWMAAAAPRLAGATAFLQKHGCRPPNFYPNLIKPQSPHQTKTIKPTNQFRFRKLLCKVRKGSAIPYEIEILPYTLPLTCPKCYLTIRNFVRYVFLNDFPIHLLVSCDLLVRTPNFRIDEKAFYL